jgi:hypothetical protein
MKTYLFKVEIAFPNDPNRTNEWYVSTIQGDNVSVCIQSLYHEITRKYNTLTVIPYIREIHVEVQIAGGGK